MTWFKVISGGGEGIDTSNLEWIPYRSIATLPRGCCGATILVFNNELYMIGGRDYNDTYYYYIYKFNNNNKYWYQTNYKIPYTIMNSSSCIYNNEVHIMGGYDPNGAGGFDYHYKWNGSTWTRVSTLPYGMNNCSAVVYNNEMHILASMHYKWDGTSWVSLSTLPYNSPQHAIIYKDELHVFGVYDNDTSKLDDHYKWDGTSWTKLSKSPYALGKSSGTMIEYNNNLYLVFERGGLYKYDGNSFQQLHDLLPYNSYAKMVVYDKYIYYIGSNHPNFEKSHYDIIPYYLLPKEI